MLSDVMVYSELYLRRYTNFLQLALYFEYGYFLIYSFNKSCDNYYNPALFFSFVKIEIPFLLLDMR